MAGAEAPRLLRLSPFVEVDPRSSLGEDLADVLMDTEYTCVVAYTPKGSEYTYFLIGALNIPIGVSFVVVVPASVVLIS